MSARTASLAWLWAALFCFAGAVQAQNQYQLGRDYIRAEAPGGGPAVASSGPAIEVTEFFWYGCPHCYAMEPWLARWSSGLARDVVLRRMPAVPNAQWGVAARVYFALDALGEETRLRRALFDAIHKDGLRITDESAMSAWLARQGVNPERYAEAYRSAAVDERIERAAQITRDYRIGSLGVPALMVGSYLTSADMADTPSELLAITDFLVQQTRRERGDAGRK